MEMGLNKFENAINADETVGENEDVSRDNIVVKLTKAEMPAKFKKLRKEAKKQGKDVTEEVEEVQQNSQAEVLAEVEKIWQLKKPLRRSLGLLKSEHPCSWIPKAILND